MKLKFKLWPTIFTTIGLALLLALGTWQGSRFLEKKEMETARDAQTAKPVLAATSFAQLQDAEYRRVELTAGELKPEWIHFVKYRHHDSKPGAWVVVPIVIGDEALLFNLGFLPVKDAQKVTAEEVAQQLDYSVFQPPFTGLLVPVDKPVPDLETVKSLGKDPSYIEWRSLDLDGMYGAMPYKGMTRKVLVRDSEGQALPIGGYEHVTQPYMTSERHLGYSMTWYLMAVGLLALFLAASAGVLGRRG